MPATDAIETMAPFRCGRMRLIASAAQKNMPVRCVLRTECQSAWLIFCASATRWMPALLTSTSTPAGLAVDRREGGRDARRVGDVAGEVVDARMPRLRLAEVDREDDRALVAERDRDRFADAARGAGDHRDLAFKCRIGSHGGRP